MHVFTSAASQDATRMFPALVTLSQILRYSHGKVRFAAARTEHPLIPRARRSQNHGDDQIRTGDPLLAKQVLSQLSYIPKSEDLFT